MGRAWWDSLSGALGVVSGLACIIGGPVACAVTTIVAVATSGYARYRNGERGFALLRGIAIDAVGLAFKPLRLLKRIAPAGKRFFPLPRRAVTSTWRTIRARIGAPYGHRMAKGKWYRLRSYRVAFRPGNRVRMFARAGYSGYSIYSGSQSIRKWR